MRPSVKKVYHDFISNPGRSILIILSIAVGLFAIGVILTLWLSLPVDLRLGYEKSNPANIYLRITDFDEALVKSVGKMPEVADAMGVRNVSLRVQNVQKNLEIIQIMGVPADWTVNQVKVLEGSWPLKKGEVALENFKFDQLGFQIGDVVEIKTNSGKLVPFVLTARVQDQTVGVTDYSQVFIAPIHAYVNRDSLRALEVPEAWNLLEVAVKGNGNSTALLDRVSVSIKDKLEKEGSDIYATVLAKKSLHPIVDYVNAIAGTLFIIGILILFLSGTLIYNTLAAILSQQIRQIGAMKTIGATYRQLVSMYIHLIFLYSLTALAISIPLSYVASIWFRNFLAHAINYEIMRGAFVWESIATQIALGLIIPQIAGAIPVSKGAKISIQSALTSFGDRGKRRSGKTSLFLTWFTRIFSRPVALSLRNMFSNKIRLFLTLLTLSIGGGIFIASFNVTDTINETVASISRYFKAELSVNLSAPYRSERFIEDIASFDTVDFGEGWGAGAAVYKLPNNQIGPTISIMAPPANSMLIESKMKSGRWFVPGEDNVVILSERFSYTYPDVKVGDQIILNVDNTGSNTTWTVIGFFTMAGKSGGFMAYMPLTSWERVSSSGSRLTKFQVKLKQPVSTMKSIRLFWVKSFTGSQRL